jgi:hypothetical protein
VSGSVTMGSAPHTELVIGLSETKGVIVSGRVTMGSAPPHTELVIGLSETKEVMVSGSVRPYMHSERSSMLVLRTSISALSYLIVLSSNAVV